jgi:apolipoprotein D and lipocalin family protein
MKINLSIAAFATSAFIFLSNSFTGVAFGQESPQKAIQSTTSANLTTPSTKPLETVASVDLKRYVGTWHEIALFPNRFQAQCVADTTATYKLKENGRIEVTNRCRLADGRMEDAVGEAKLADAADTAKLKVRFAPWILSFLPQVWGNYWVIDLDADYQVAVVSEPSRKFLWILSRSPKLADDKLAALKKRLETMGFEVSRLQFTPQMAAKAAKAAE